MMARGGSSAQGTTRPPCPAAAGRPGSPAGSSCASAAEALVLVPEFALITGLRFTVLPLVVFRRRR